jgi:poly(A) polymerase
MALSRERIADELLKILALPDPASVMALMVEQNILRPVLPEINGAAVESLSQLIRAEAGARVEPGALRRLAALLPRDPEIAAFVGARLRLSTKATKRLVSAASRAEEPGSPEVLAYRIGGGEAIDRLLLNGRVADAARLTNWTRPRFRVGGGDLIKMGLKPGPAVAATLQSLEREWAESGFPDDEQAQRDLARLHVDQALRESQ